MLADRTGRLGPTLPGVMVFDRSKFLDMVACLGDGYCLYRAIAKGLGVQPACVIKMYLAAFQVKY